MEARKRKGRAALSLFLAGVLPREILQNSRALLLLEPEKPSGYFPVQKTGNWKMC